MSLEPPLHTSPLAPPLSPILDRTQAPHPIRASPAAGTMQAKA